jgi:hypothetical protein
MFNEKKSQECVYAALACELYKGHRLPEISLFFSEDGTSGSSQLDRVVWTLRTYNRWG